METTYCVGEELTFTAELTNNEVHVREKKKTRIQYRILGEKKIYDFPGDCYIDASGYLAVDHAFDETFAGKTIEVLYYIKTPEDGKKVTLTFQTLTGIWMRFFSRGANNAAVAQIFQWQPDAKGTYTFIDNHTAQPHDGTNPEVVAVADALTQLMSKPVGKALVLDINTRKGKSLEVRLNNGHNSKAGENGLYIKYDSTTTTGGLTTNGGIKRPPFIPFGHELGHIQNVWDGKVDRDIWYTVPNLKGNFEKVKKAEIYGCHIENKIRAEHGLALRMYYGRVTSKKPAGAGPRLLFRNTRQSRYFDQNEQPNPKYKPIKRKKQTPYTY